MQAAEPDDPQDAVVARQYKEEPDVYKRTAKHWAQIYAGGERGRGRELGGREGRKEGRRCLISSLPISSCTIAPRGVGEDIADIDSKLQQLMSMGIGEVCSRNSIN